MSVSKLTELSLAQARDGLRRKDFTSVELTQEHIAAMEAGRKLNAVILETPEKALDMAKTSEIMDQFLFTNGTLLNQKNSEIILNSSFKKSSRY